MTVETLQHIAFIMDGNRRWAKKRGLPVVMGHKKGAEVLIDTAKAVKKLGVKYMTVYAFSTENWQREKSEVDGLMNLLRNYLDNSFKELEENNVKIIFIGEKELLDADIIAKMANIENKTAQNDGLVLCVALSYGGRQEIVSAAKKVAALVQNGDLSLSVAKESLAASKIAESPGIITINGVLNLFDQSAGLSVPVFSFQIDNSLFRL